MKKLDLDRIEKEYSSQLKRISIEEGAMGHPNGTGLFTQSELDLLNQEIEIYGKIFKLNLSELPPKNIPALTARMPNVDYKSVRFNQVTRALDSLFVKLDNQFIAFDDETVIQFAENMENFTVNYEGISHTFNTPKDLIAHIKSGKKAYLHFQFRQGFVKWVSERDGNLRMAWVKEREDFSHLSGVVVMALAEVNRIKRFATAFKQHLELNKILPFKWAAATIPTRGGLSGNTKSMMNGNVSNTVIHLKLEDDISIGRLKRSNGDLLCTTSKSRLRNDLGLYTKEYSFALSTGEELSNIPGEITCQECLKKIEAIKTKYKGN